MNPNSRSPKTTAVELLNFPAERLEFEADPKTYVLYRCAVYEGTETYILEVRSWLDRLKSASDFRDLL